MSLDCIATRNLKRWRFHTRYFNPIENDLETFPVIVDEIEFWYLLIHFVVFTDFSHFSR